MILFSDDNDPAMRYEGLARAAFNNCRKKEDPWGYAAQERFTNFVPEPNLTGKRALATILIKLIIENSDTSYSDELIELEQKVWDSTSQGEIINIIDSSIELVKNIKS